MNSSIKIRRAMTSLAHLTLFTAALAGPKLSAQNAGVPNVSRLANAGFDAYTSYPSPAIQQWLRDHFYRMTVFPPYFDSRTSWYPRGDVYTSLYGIQQGSQLQYDHPEWILKNQYGTWLSIPWGCGGGWCPLWAADVSNPGYRAWWVNNIRAELSHGYYGVFIDDVNMEFRVGDSYGNEVPPLDPNTGQLMTWDNWRRYVAEFLEQIRAGLPGAEIVHNSIWYAGPPGIRDADPYIQRQIAAADVINIEHGIGSDGGLTGGTWIWATSTLLAYIDRVHSRGRVVNFMEFSNNTVDQEYALAGYFLISTGRDEIGDSITTPDNWWNGYNVNLGTPLGPYSYNNGVFRREFSGGVVLLNDPGAPTQTINVGAGYSNLNGVPVQGVTLDGHRGAVLVKSGSSSSSAPSSSTPSSSTSQYLSDLNWTSSINGWGPVEKNISNGESAGGDGHPLRIRGAAYAKGLGVHSYSEIHYALGGRCSSLNAVVGIDDEVPVGVYGGSVVFQVWADGTKLYDSGTLIRSGPATPLSVVLSGHYDLSLVVTNAGDSYDYDHADWADAKIVCSP